MFTGKEKKSLAYVIAIMNMILHGIDAPNIIHTNTLTENLSDIQDKNRFDVILANPPFGGKERKEVQQNFPIKTGETAFLFLQHFIKILKKGGKAAVVIKNTFLSNSDNASRALRQELLSSCNLHTILDCPGGTFIGAGVKTVVLFFEKRPLSEVEEGVPFDFAQGTGMPLFSQGKPLNEGMATQKIWYYQLDPGRSLGKTNALNDEDLREFIELQATFAESEKSWLVDIADVDRETFDLSVKNPNKLEESTLREPQEILDEAFEGIDRAIANTEKNLANSRELFESYLNAIFTQKGDRWEEKTLKQVSIQFGRGKSRHRPRNDKKLYGGKYPFIQTGDIRNSNHTVRSYLQTYNEVGLAQSKLWPKGTVCITIAANIAETGVLDFEACIPDSVIGIVADQNKANNMFIEYMLQAFKLFLKAKGKGSAQDNINMGTFKAQTFPFPPIDEQEKIVSKLDFLSTETQRLEAIYRQKLAVLNELKQSILQKAFTGELTANTPKTAKEKIAA